MFSDRRIILDKGTREPMARHNKLNIVDQGPPTGVYVESPGFAQRKAYVNNFQNCVSSSVILEYDSVDQQETCACSFVGFINMCRIYTLIHKEHILPINIHTKWKSIWNNFQVCTATDIAMTLDKLVSKYAGKKEWKALDIVIYQPIRSAGNSERVFDKSFWVRKQDLFLKFPESKEFHDRNNGKVWDEWLFQIAYLVESLIDRKIPVEINSQSHSRTCIAYNNSELLFADNYGNDYNVDYTGMETCRGGFCKLNKWLVYSTVRDLCYLEPPKKLTAQSDVSVEQIKPPASIKPASVNNPATHQSHQSKKPETVGSNKTCSEYEKMTYAELKHECRALQEKHKLSSKDMPCNVKRENLVKNLFKFTSCTM